ncbi:hypothetical protein NDU88_001532 [Pleurodeles waltl]|uniref:Uncharacterized protein n=1 Tax=Pleurodeles waltl TaxID=8319 RepID=A0AAV7MP00_PLEWA|nr:hypothetical protein NDU88_001532 [Pleurodeles waltl]
MSHWGRGRATKEDGRLNPELHAVAVPRRWWGPCGGRAEAEIITSTRVGIPPPPPSSRPEPKRPAAEILSDGSASRKEMTCREGGVASLRPCDRPF